VISRLALEFEKAPGQELAPFKSFIATVYSEWWLAAHAMMALTALLP
jgi:hypothetical protein